MSGDKRLPRLRRLPVLDAFEKEDISELRRIIISLKQLVKGKTMPKNPTQKQLTDSIKFLWEGLGGKISLMLFLITSMMMPFATFSKTQWWEVPPTNSVEEVMSEAGFATTGYVNRVAYAALQALTNDFGKNFLPLAAPIITNTVEDILTPCTVEWSFGTNDTMKAAVMPNFTTSRVSMRFKDSEDPSAQNGNLTGNIFASGELRNFSMIIDSLPQGQGFYVFLVDSNLVQNCKIYATPGMQQIDDKVGFSAIGWIISTNDIPCVVTVRQPDLTTLLFRRDKVNSR